MSLQEVSFAFQAPAGRPSEWRLAALSCEEELSRLTVCAVELAADSPDADPRALLGQTAVATIHRGALSRHFAGIIRAVDDLGVADQRRVARVEIVPELWELSQRSTSRIYQDLDVIDIVRAVLDDADAYKHAGGFVTKLDREAHPKREYCVQYRETDLQFVQRLLEEEGLAYHFTHGPTRESLRVVDARHPEAWGAAPLQIAGPVAVMDEATATAEGETVHHLTGCHELRPHGITLRDFDFTHPHAHEAMTVTRTAEAGRRTLYEYPARYVLHDYDDGAGVYQENNRDRIRDVRMEAEQYTAETATGAGLVLGFAPGATFVSARHVAPSMNRAWLLVRVSHTARAPEVLGRHGLHDVRYANQFGCIPHTRERVFRPALRTPRPVIVGPQTATVMAERGTTEEISVDKHGRVLVRFHWDRPELRQGAQRQKNSSCWIRVAQSWAGGGWGMTTIPRVDMEVVVHFLDGDPDRPLITGCVHNGTRRPGLALPQERTRTSFRTNTSPGGGGFNELTFDDERGRELLYLRAQRDRKTLVRRDDTRETGRNHTATVHGRERVTIGGDQVIAVGGNSAFTVAGNDDRRVRGAHGAKLSVDHNYTLDAGDTVTVKCGSATVEMTPTKIVLKSGGGAVIELDGAEVRITGTPVKVNC